MDFVNPIRSPGLGPCASGAVQCGREGCVGVDTRVLLLLAVDRVVFLDVYEQRKFDLSEGVRRARAVATLVVITEKKGGQGRNVTLLMSLVPEEHQSTEVWLS